MQLCAAWGCGVGAIPLLKETSNGYRLSGLAGAGVPLQQQARLVRMPSCPPRHRPDHRMRMNASPVSEQLAGLVAFWSAAPRCAMKVCSCVGQRTTMRPLTKDHVAPEPDIRVATNEPPESP